MDRLVVLSSVRPDRGLLARGKRWGSPSWDAGIGREHSQGAGRHMRRRRPTTRGDEHQQAGARYVLPREFNLDNREVNVMTIKAINVRNQFRGRVKEILKGPVVSEVDVETPAGIVTSVITSRSIVDLDLKVGSEVLALIKSTEVALAKL